jgi:hypothetical protein
MATNRTLPEVAPARTAIFPHEADERLLRAYRERLQGELEEVERQLELLRR